MIVQHNVGMMGFFGTRRDVYILDDYALSDPLLARLPVTGAWRIGHFKREIPPGYIETLGTGTNRIVDEGLAAYYDSIQTITRSPLFSVARLREVVLMNLGLRDHLLDSYLDTLR
jgi:arabinofuranosyltransferase